MESAKRRAIQAAKFENNGRFRIGAVVTKKKRWIAIGANNMEKTDPKSLNPWMCQHAEQVAINKANGAGDTIVIARLDKSDKLALARPCPHCMNAIRNAGYRRMLLQL